MGSGGEKGNWINNLNHPKNVNHEWGISLFFESQKSLEVGTLHILMASSALFLFRHTVIIPQCSSPSYQIWSEKYCGRVIVLREKNCETEERVETWADNLMLCLSFSHTCPSSPAIISCVCVCAHTHLHFPNIHFYSDAVSPHNRCLLKACIFPDLHF